MNSLCVVFEKSSPTFLLVKNRNDLSAVVSAVSPGFWIITSIPFENFLAMSSSSVEVITTHEPLEDAKRMEPSKTP
jgi:uncharacterized protein YcgL (UPF0745 family)